MKFGYNFSPVCVAGAGGPVRSCHTGLPAAAGRTLADGAGPGTKGKDICVIMRVYIYICVYTRARMNACIHSSIHKYHT